MEEQPITVMVYSFFNFFAADVVQLEDSKGNTILIVVPLPQQQNKLSVCIHVLGRLLQTIYKMLNVMQFNVNLIIFYDQVYLLRLAFNAQLRYFCNAIRRAFFQLLEVESEFDQLQSS